MDNLSAILFDKTTEHQHGYLCENIEDRQHDQNEIVKWAQQVLDSLKDDTHCFDLVEKCEQFDHADEHNDFAHLDRVVVLLKVTLALDEVDQSRNVKYLTQGLGPDPEMVHVGLYRPGDENVADHLEKHDEVDCQLYHDPSMNLPFR